MRALSIFLISAANASFMILTSKSVYYELGQTKLTELFNSYDLSCEMSIYYLFRLLVAHNGWLKHFYDSQEVSPERAQQMVENFLPRPELHPVLLSFRLCSHNVELVENLRPRLHLYQPDTLGYLSCQEKHFTDEDMSVIFKNQGFRPEFYVHPDIIKAVTRLAPDMSYDLNDALWAAGNEDVSVHYDLGPKLTAISTVIASQGQSRSRTRQAIITLGNAEFFVALENFLTGPSRHNFYPLLLEHVKNETKQMTPARRALWHGKLLYLEVSLASKSRLHVEECHQFVSDYVRQHKVSVLPPVLLRKTFKMVRNLGLLTTNDKSLEKRFASISKTHTNCPLVLADLPQHVQRWRDTVKVLQKKVMPSLKRPTSADKLSILLWWGTYESLADVTVFNPEFRSPITYRGTHLNQSLESVASLLKVLRKALLTSNGPLIRTQSGVEFRKTSCFSTSYKAVARTITVSLFYEDCLGFSFTDDALDELYSTDSHSDWNVQQYIKGQLDTVHFFNHIPRAILKGSTTASALTTGSVILHDSKVDCATAPTPRLGNRSVFVASLCFMGIAILLSILGIV